MFILAEKILKSIKWFSEEISYCCPELATHFQSDAWTDFKKVLENEIRCQVAVSFYMQCLLKRLFFNF